VWAAVEALVCRRVLQAEGTGHVDHGDVLGHDLVDDLDAGPVRQAHQHHVRAFDGLGRRQALEHEVRATL
jgi:hypothetical protein